MSQSFVMKSGAIVLTILLGIPGAARAHLEVQTRDNVSFVSGGIGNEERHAIEAMANRFNVKLTMAIATGQLIGEAQVRIQDTRGSTVLDTVTDGPLLYAQLQPGTYIVSCNVEGQQRKRAVQVTGRKQVQVTLTWPRME